MGARHNEVSLEGGDIPNEAFHLVGEDGRFSLCNESPTGVLMVNRSPLKTGDRLVLMTGDTIVIGFGPDASAISAEDRDRVQEMLRVFRPETEVVEIASHDWVADELSGETWPMHRPGYLTESLPEFQRAHGRVLFAGSDYADGWGGFIDGAIQSGLRAVNAVEELL